MRVPARVRRIHDRVDDWLCPRKPVTHRDAWRYSTALGLIFATSAAGYFVSGSAAWSVVLALAAPAMAAFTFGFAVRRGSTRQRLIPVVVGIVGVAVPIAVPGVGDRLLAVLSGPVGVLLASFLLLLGLLGYAFPDAVPDPANGGDGDGNPPSDEEATATES